MHTIRRGLALSLQIPWIEYFDRADLVLISSHLIKTLHYPFSSNENEDTAASSFCLIFVVAVWVHQYLLQGGSIIGSLGGGHTDTHTYAHFADKINI